MEERDKKKILSAWKARIKVIFPYLKDRVSFTITYVLACTCLIVFYQIISPVTLEIGYPIIMVASIYLIFTGIDFTAWLIVRKRMRLLIKHAGKVDLFHKETDKETCSIINEIHSDYCRKLGDKEDKLRRERSMISACIHNMKTPVTVTNLMLQRLQRGEIVLEEVQLDLEAENRKLTAYLDNVLNMIRLEEFAKDYVPEKLDLMEELTRLINKNKTLFIQNKVFPKIESDISRALILADRKWNDAMLSQLISNAVKYSGVESKHITFRIQSLLNGYISLSIEDEGIGIPSYDLPKVFDMFFTGENGRKTDNSSGIGLYFCKEVSKMFGAKLAIESELMKGTTVTLHYLTKL